MQKTSTHEELCPECGKELEWDEVDIGVGVQRGNYRCPACGWTPEPIDQGFDDFCDEESEI